MEPVLFGEGGTRSCQGVTALDHSDFELYPSEVVLEGGSVEFTSPGQARGFGFEKVYQTFAMSSVMSAAQHVPHVIEVLDRIHVHWLGRRPCLLDHKGHSTSESVAYMTSAKEPPGNLSET